MLNFTKYYKRFYWYSRRKLLIYEGRKSARRGHTPFKFKTISYLNKILQACYQDYLHFLMV